MCLCVSVCVSHIQMPLQDLKSFHLLRSSLAASTGKPGSVWATWQRKVGQGWGNVVGVLQSGLDQARTVYGSAGGCVLCNPKLWMDFFFLPKMSCQLARWHREGKSVRKRTMINWINFHSDGYLSEKIINSSLLKLSQWKIRVLCWWLLSSLL